MVNGVPAKERKRCALVIATTTAAPTPTPAVKQINSCHCLAFIPNDTTHAYNLSLSVYAASFFPALFSSFVFKCQQL